MADENKKDEEKVPAPAPEMPNGDSIRLGQDAAGLANLLLGAGAVGIVAAVFLGGGYDGAQFQHSYLIGYMWTLAVVIGGVWWVTLQHLFGARASVVMRRSGELLAQGSWIMAILVLPILVPIWQGNDALFVWADHHHMVSQHHLQGKAGYLSATWVTVRLAVYFVVFIGVSNFWLKRSLKQDATTGDVALTKKMQGQAAPAMILITLAVTFIAIDLMMSLDPVWFSTIFGVYYFATCVIMFHSVLVLGLLWAQKKGHLKKSVTKEHFHDLGKMMFAFTCFWTYIAFSQFMLIWYANIPEESHWYGERFEGSWVNASLILAATHFVIPFFGMMSRSMKRHTGRLSFWAVYLVAVCWFDMYWLVAPNLHKSGVVFHPADFLAAFGILGVLLGFVLLRGKDVNLVAVGDPRLKRSLSFQNI